MKWMLLPLLVLAGCASRPVTRVSGPDGTRDWYVLQCPTTAACMNQSAKTCGGKYEVLSHQQQAGRLVLVPAPGFIVGGRTRGKQEFVVHCLYDNDGDDGDYDDPDE